jgi:uncharacterized protein with PhoU and TrkA domain
MKFNPTSQTIIKEGDIHIVVGETVKLSLLEEMARS